MKGEDKEFYKMYLIEWTLDKPLFAFLCSYSGTRDQDIYE